MNISKPVIFWDWNGTLLDDTLICVQTMNEMLQKRGIHEIDLEYYKSVFGFPVIEYYKELGFDFNKHSFEELSVEFIDGYNNRVEDAKLHDSALQVLEYFKQLGKKQVVISAMEETMLNSLLLANNIRNYFDDVKGLTDIYAKGKVHLAEDYIYDHKLNPDNILFIGDTLHDIEVSEEIGCEIILVSNGHHSFDRLSYNGHQVINDLKFLLSLN